LNKPTLLYSSIGQQHSYAEVWELQTHLQQKLITAKRSGELGHPGYLLLCEHAPVYTIGKSGKVEHLLLSESQIERSEFEFFKINRGGDITYHGPGQITGYPIMDLDQYYHDLHRYVRELEEVIIRTLARWGIQGKRVEGYTGVWLASENRQEGEHLRKICAIGVHMSRWVSMHGFALNVNTNLDHFENIIPCGIKESNMEVTSMEHELGRSMNLEEVRNEICEQMEHVFLCNVALTTDA
jgi:lipoyl(octanoyl) transferase